MQLTVLDERAQRCYRRSGSSQQGAARQLHDGDGCCHEAIMMAILRQDWERLT